MDPLHNHAQSGDYQYVYQTITQNPKKLHSICSQGSGYYGFEFTLLHSACSGSDNSLSVVQLLVNFGLSVNEVGREGRESVTPILIAVRRGNVNIVRYLVSVGADYKGISARDVISSKNIQLLDFFYSLNNQMFQITSFKVDCIKYSDDRVCEYLLSKDSKYFNNTECCFAAIETDNVKKFEYIASSGYLVNKETIIEKVIKDKKKNIFKYYAKRDIDFSKYIKDWESYEFLNDNAPEAFNNFKQPLHNFIGGSGWSLLHYLARDGKHTLIKNLIINTKRDLDCSATTGLDGEYNHGWTPLHIAAYHKQFLCVKMLVECGAYIDAMDEFKWTPLYWSLFLGDYQTARYLMQKKAVFTHKVIGPKRKSRMIGSSGWTGLLLASVSGNLDCIKYLVKDGAKINEVTADGHSALNIATINGHVDVVRYFLELKVNIDHQDSIEEWSPLHAASSRGFTEIARMLIDAGADIESEDRTDWTPLHHACRYGYSSIVKLLIDKGAKLDKTINDENEETALHLAAKFGHIDVVQVLLSKTINVNIEDKLERTPLHLAVISNHSQIVQSLLGRKAKINVKDNKGNTPLHYAVRANSESIAEMLLRNGASQIIENDDSVTAQHLARNNYNMLNILRKYKNE